MKQETTRAIVVFFGLLLLATLACGPGGVDLPEVTIPAGAAETAESAAAQAGELAGTAAAVAGEQGGGLVATLEATDFNIDIQFDSEAIREKFSSVQPDESGNITVAITDQEINEALQVADTGGVSPIQNLNVSFTGGNVVFSGDVTQPLQGRLTASFSAAVIDGQLQLDLVNARIGSVPVPPSLLDSLESTINERVATQLSRLPTSYTLQNVVIEEGSMTIMASRN